MAARTTRRLQGGGHRPRRALTLCIGAALASFAPRWPSSFAAPGMPGRQGQGAPNIRSSLPQTYELPPDEAEPEPVEKEPAPLRRLPYSIHITSHMPNNEHLGEDKGTMKQIQEKLANALENSEELIQHVEVRFQVSDHFHKDKQGRGKVRAKGLEAMPSKLASEDGEDGPMLSAAELKEEAANNPGAREIAPYHFEVTVELKNKRQVVLSKSKHAQPTLPEALDHTSDALRNLMKVEKERQIKEWRKPKTGGVDEDLDPLDIEAEVNRESDPEAAEQAKLEESYKEMIEVETFIDESYKQA